MKIFGRLSDDLVCLHYASSLSSALQFMLKSEHKQFVVLEDNGYIELYTKSDGTIKRMAGTKD